MDALTVMHQEILSSGEVPVDQFSARIFRNPAVVEFHPNSQQIYFHKETTSRAVNTKGNLLWE